MKKTEYFFSGNFIVLHVGKKQNWHQNEIVSDPEGGSDIYYGAPQGFYISNVQLVSFQKDKLLEIWKLWKPLLKWLSSTKNLSLIVC